MKREKLSIMCFIEFMKQKYNGTHISLCDKLLVFFLFSEKREKSLFVLLKNIRNLENLNCQWNDFEI